MHTVKQLQLPNISRIPLLELPELTFGAFLPKYDEKYALHETPKHHGAGGPRDSDYLLQKEREAEEKEWGEDRRVKAMAAQRAAKVQSASGGNRAGSSNGSRGRDRRKLPTPVSKHASV